MQRPLPDNPVLAQRRAGILLHPTSLPGPADNGDFGPDAYRFIEFLAATGSSVWQMLPLGPTHPDGSPYQCLSAHAGKPELISLSWLADRGWLSPTLIPARLDAGLRRECLSRAFKQFLQRADETLRQDFSAFRQQQAVWLDDYALFQVIRRQQGERDWPNWPRHLRDREAVALERLRHECALELDEECFIQYVFFRQWQELRDYAHRHGVLLFGDMPIFVAHDSADVWAHREFFQLDADGQPVVVAGVPPDYFSRTGQRWGNPHYDWQRMQEDGFSWWIDRMRTQLQLFDLIRIDHFRGFEAYWEIPASARTAREGRWVKVEGEALLQRLFEVFPELALVAEDLGIITPEVEALRDRFHLPGMKILQFAFDSDARNPYLPHNCVPNSVVYTGTHDNDTTLGWYEHGGTALRQRLADYLGCPVEDMPWPLNRAALASVARLAVLPMQDLLGLGEGHRMNTPGTTEGNWQWRFEWGQLEDATGERLRHLITLYGRQPEAAGPRDE